MPRSSRRDSWDLFLALRSNCFGRVVGNVKSEDEFLKLFRIPDYILAPSSQRVELSASTPEFPVIVFINSSSGGQLGGDLLETYRGLLNSAQVFDLRKEPPDKVLHKLYGNIEKLKSCGDVVAAEIQKRLKLIVAGGDGTASWLLGVVCDLKLAHPPPIATVPLGTGNNLPFSFGWGRKNPGTDPQSVKSFLAQVLKAKEMKIDSWHITMRMKAPKEISCDPIAPLELPHSLHAFHRVSNLEGSIEEDVRTFRGGFWNYFSLGMDAQVSYAFHSERKLHPDKFKNQISNQCTYARLACTQGWFCASLFHPISRNIVHLARIKIMNKHRSWRDLKIPSSVRSIVCLNLPSFSGGLNPWGTPNERKARDRELTPPLVDDGLLEVVGFRDGWHGFVLLTPKGHGTRLAQAHGIRFEFRKGAADHVYLRLDGEPWKQPLPTDDDTVVVEISSLGKVKILATQECRARSVNDFSPSISSCSLEDDMVRCEDPDGGSGERRKFGAAETFRFPDDVHISHLV